MEMGEFRHPVYTLDSKADINYGEAQLILIGVYRVFDWQTDGGGGRDEA